MRYRYYICDVFTDTRFGGNQLAVLPEAQGLSDRQMQQIAREFNFSESTFVLPAEAGHTRKVRIFTPTTEVPFAGHPNIGTAFVLAAAGEFGPIEPSITVTFEEKAGLVPITIQRREGGCSGVSCRRPQRLSLGKTVSAETAGEGGVAHPGRRRHRDASAPGGLGRPAVPDGGAQGPRGARAGAGQHGRAGRPRRRRRDARHPSVRPERRRVRPPGAHVRASRRRAGGSRDRQRQLRPGRTAQPARRQRPTAASAGASPRAWRWGVPAFWRPARRSETGVVVDIRIGGASVLVSEGFIEVD